MSSGSYKDKYLDLESNAKKKSHKKEKKKKHKKHKHKSKRKSSTSNDSSSEAEWVEKSTNAEKSEKINEKIERDNWMTEASSFEIRTFSKPEKQNKQKKEDEKRRLDSYNPSTNIRELNPHWKNGGTGLPSQEFKKPGQNECGSSKYSSSSTKASGSWRKKSTISTITSSEADSSSSDRIENCNLSDKEINSLAAKIIKAEILGNKELCDKLKTHLDAARNFRQQNTFKESSQEEQVVLISTDSKGISRPLERRSEHSNPYGSKKKKQKLDSHEHGERVRYFGDDDRYSLREMFEQEKYNTSNDTNEEFMKVSAKMKNPNDDLEDIFMDKAQHVTSDDKIDEMNRNKAIRSHQMLTQSIESCNFCIDSTPALKNVIISIGEYVYLSVPSYQSLTDGHCILAPIKHVPCSTQLDENIWEEIETFRKTITKMFSANNLTTVFFEVATNLNKYPHMAIECVPLTLDEGSMAPMYFKKAILECEKEWAMNKKLVDLRGKNVRRAIPKGLAYFQVGFDNDPGFAHVIESKYDFPKKFAQEIIAGLLDLDHNRWRRPLKENSDEQQKKVTYFKKMWNTFDCTK